MKLNNNNNEAFTRMIDKCDDTKNKELFQFVFGNKIKAIFYRVVEEVLILVL